MTYINSIMEEKKCRNKGLQKKWSSMLLLKSHEVMDGAGYG